MKNLQSLLTSVLIIVLIASCSNLPSSPNPSSTIPQNEEIHPQIKIPEIPFNRDGAFFPLRYKDGKLVPSYQWKVCVKEIVVCLKWETKTVYFEDLEWFYLNDFGLTKRRRP